ncbi:MAG: chloride channel protein, partial [bacterium]
LKSLFSSLLHPRKLLASGISEVERAWPPWARVDLLAALVGVVSGCLAAALYGGVHLFEAFLLQGPLGIPEDLSGRFHLSPLTVTLLLIIPALGGLGVGLVAKYACAEAGGGGTNDILRSYHRRGAVMSGAIVPFKWLTSCLTLGSGGAGGNEGPAAQIGAAFGSWLAQKLDLGLAERGLLLTAGVAGGIGAIFRAPLGGALFACELYYSSPELESTALLPSLIASVSAYFVFGLFCGYQSLIPGDTPFTLSVGNFVALGLTAVLCALGARVYVWWMKLCSKQFSGLLPMPWRPAVGGFLTGALALGGLLISQHWLSSDGRAWAVLGEGYPILSSAVLAGAGAGVLLLMLVAVGKLLASGLTVGSGGSAGVFAPSMIIGGCLGAVACIAFAALGWSPVAAKAYVLAGMAAFFAAGTACPLASLIIITEVAQGYHLLPGLMLAVALGYLLRPKPGLFKDQVVGSLESPVHQAELESAFLASRRVGQLCRRVAKARRGQGPALKEDQNLGDALSMLRDSGAAELPVLNADGVVVGLFAYGDMFH